jgi:Rha family phage regulatory protein
MGLAVRIEKIDGLNVVNSRVVAEQLGKEHRRILQDIREKALHEFVQWIIPNKYKASNGQEYDEFLLTKDGFIMLVFNYTGYNDFKEAYINEFNRMEKQISEPKPRPSKRLEDKTPHEVLADNGRAMMDFFECMNLNIPKEIIAHTAVVGTTNQTGYAFDEVKLLLNKQEEEAYHTKSEICKRVGIKQNKTNLALIELGIQVEGSTSMQPYTLTELGKQYGVERSYTKNGHQGYEIKLKESAVEYIKENLEILPASWVK